MKTLILIFIITFQVPHALKANTITDENSITELKEVDITGITANTSIKTALIFNKNKVSFVEQWSCEGCQDRPKWERVRTYKIVGKEKDNLANIHYYGIETNSLIEVVERLNIPQKSLWSVKIIERTPLCKNSYILNERYYFRMNLKTNLVFHSNIPK